MMMFPEADDASAWANSIWSLPADLYPASQTNPDQDFSDSGELRDFPLLKFVAGPGVELLQMRNYSCIFTR